MTSVMHEPLPKYATPAALEARLAPDEPWFAIRGQDVLAPQALAAYAGLLRTLGETEQAQQVEGVAITMLRWQATHKDKLKVPD